MIPPMSAHIRLLPSHWLHNGYRIGIAIVCPGSTAPGGTAGFSPIAAPQGLSAYADGGAGFNWMRAS